MGAFTAAGAAAKDVKTAASNILIAESTGEVSTTATNYVKKKVIGMPANRVRPTIRVSFTLKRTTAACAVQGKLYYNGVACGAERSSSSTSYATYSADIQPTTNGGTIELYLKTLNASNPAVSDNLSIKGDETEINQEYEVIT